MPEKIFDPAPPRGLARLAFRAPIGLYRLGLGRLLGTRFLQLTHVGRKSGKERQTVLEVGRYDKEKAVFVVAAGFRPKSDWYRNILAHPQVTVRSGGQRYRMIAYPLPPEEAGEELLDYARRHPKALQELARFMGYRIDGSEADVHALGKMLSMVAFHPLDEAGKR